MSNLTSPGKWHGGKSHLAKRIIALMPPRCLNPNDPDPADAGWLHYVEPYFGMGAVMLANDPEGISEVVNDMNGELTNFWLHLQDPVSFEQLKRSLEATPFSSIEFDASQLPGSTGLERAKRFFILNRQSRQGLMEDFATLSRNRTRRGMNEQASSWLGAIEGLPQVHKRIKRIVILNDKAISVIRQQAGPRTLFYIDAPYIHSTRVTTSDYEHEMSDADHQELIDLIVSSPGKFLVSMYHHAIYDALHLKHGFQLHEIAIPNSASGKKEKDIKIECVWVRG